MRWLDGHLGTKRTELKIVERLLCGLQPRHEPPDCVGCQEQRIGLLEVA